MCSSERFALMRMSNEFNFAAELNGGRSRRMGGDTDEEWIWSLSRVGSLGPASVW